MNKLSYVPKCFMRIIVSTTNLYFPFFLLFFTLFLSTTNTHAVCTAGNQGALQTCINNSGGDPNIQLTADIAITGTLNIKAKTFTLMIGIYNLTNCNLIDANGSSHMTGTDGVNGSMLFDNLIAPTYSSLGANGNLRNFFFSVLPIEFQSFDASYKGKDVLLTWLVSQEKTDAFTIERSSDGRVFDKIGSVKVNNHSDTPQYFSFMDEKPLAVLSYYRIKSTEWAGKEFYSKSIAVMGVNGGKTVKIYPNPVGTEGFITVESTGDIHNIIITNTLGQVVLTSNVSKINIAQLSKGVYNITVKTRDDTMTEKFFKN
jgi:hypothetical protein